MYSFTGHERELIEPMYRKPEKYHEAYDCRLEQEILFRIFAHVLPADNPQQAESASNAGVHSNSWCRYGNAGGTSAERETDDGYRALFKVWDLLSKTIYF